LALIERGEEPDTRTSRVVVAKPGLDGHDRGAKIIARALRDAGMEVIYTGLRQSPEMVAAAALQEDVDVIGVSILSGAHMTLFPKLKAQMDAEGLDDVLLIGGGVIPDEDIPKLKEMGVDKVFTPGTPVKDVISYITAWASRRNLA
jgi:methylmalonyl-CoA mutase, C-terminal domain